MYFFFFNDTATTEIYTLSLHDALPISLNAGPLCTTCTTCTTAGVPAASHDRHRRQHPLRVERAVRHVRGRRRRTSAADRKSTRLNSSHANISYAVFCLKKKTVNINTSH